MDKKEVIRSPFFYVGDKYKLMPQLKGLMPNKIEHYVEPFVGGGSSFLNTKSNRYSLNDIDANVIALHKEISSYASQPGELIAQLFSIIEQYNLSCSFQFNCVPQSLKREFPKTYFAKYNKAGYLKLREDFNNDKSDLLKLYILLIYGFNHMIRFNSSNVFNLPVGNVDFNKNVYQSLNDYVAFTKGKDISFFNFDYKDFLSKINLGQGSYVFFDPPYLISSSEYNKLWDCSKEIELLSCLDWLDANNIKFGITNLVSHKEKTNDIFASWMQKYFVFPIRSNYISFNDNSIKQQSQEVFVTNYHVK